MIVRYYVGGYIPAAPAQNKAEQWDDVARTYTAWNSAGAQTSTRAFNAAENAAADAQAASQTRSANQTTLTAQAVAAIAANEAWIANVAPLVVAAMDAEQAKVWPTRAATAPAFANLAAVSTHFGNVYDLILAPLVQQVVDQSQSIETLTRELVVTKQQLDATMHLVAGALDSTNGT